MSFWLQPKSLEHYLSQEEPQLLGHLRAVGALPQLPYGLWFRRCLAGCLPQSSLQRSLNSGFRSSQDTKDNQGFGGSCCSGAKVPFSPQGVGQSDQRLL